MSFLKTAFRTRHLFLRASCIAAVTNLLQHPDFCWMPKAIFKFTEALPADQHNHTSVHNKAFLTSSKYPTNAINHSQGQSLQAAGLQASARTCDLRIGSHISKVYQLYTLLDKRASETPPTTTMSSPLLAENGVLTLLEPPAPLLFPRLSREDWVLPRWPTRAGV